MRCGEIQIGGNSFRKNTSFVGRLLFLFFYLGSVWLKPMAMFRSFILTFEDGSIRTIREPRKHQTSAKTRIPKFKVYKLSTFLVYALSLFATMMLFF